MKRYIKVGVVFGLTVQAFAAECPTPHPKYKELLKSLQTISATIKDSKDCKTLAKDFEELQKKYAASNRSLIDPIKNQAVKPIEEAESARKKKEKKELTIKEINNLTNYAQDITGLMGSIVQKIDSDPSCVEKEDTPVLLTIAQITQEVTGIASQYSGPYGVPISVAGAGVAGILRGIHSIQVRNQGFDFNQQSKRELFVSSLCTYDNVRQEVESVIKPEKRKALIEFDREQMKVKVEIFGDPAFDSNGDGTIDGLDCPECRSYRQYFNAKKKIIEFFKSNSHEMEKIKQQIDTSGQEWDTCILLATVKDDKAAGVKELESILSFDPQEVADMKEWMKTLNYIKSFDGCMEISDKRVLQDANHRSLAVLENLAADSERALDDKMQELWDYGEEHKISIDSEDEQLRKEFSNINPVDWIAHSLAKIDWFTDELETIADMSNGGSAQIQREINELNLYLRQTFFAELSPQFLDWHILDAERSTKEFKGKVKHVAFELEQNVLHREAPYIEYLTYPSLPGIIQDLKSNPETNHPYVYSRLNELSLWMETGLKSMRAVEVYCSFFGEALSMSGEIFTACNNPKRTEVNRSIAEQKMNLDAIYGYLEWSVKEKKVDLEPLEELAGKATRFRKAVEGRKRKVL